MTFKLLYLYALALFAGSLIPVQAATNSVLSKVTGHVFYSSLILFVVGFAMVLLLIILFKLPPPSFDTLASAPLHSYLGGFIVATYVLSITFLAPRIGVGNAVLLVVTGQIMSAALIDQFGLFGAPVFPLNTTRAVGLVCMIIGLILAKR